GIGAVRRVVPRGLRPDRPHGSAVHGAAGGHRDRGGRRAVLPVAAHKAKLVVRGSWLVVALVTAPILVAQAAAPRRIVSLVPALTEILFAIGAGPQVIGVSNYDGYPPDVLKL